MTNNKVASYAERIERLLEERDGINADIADIYQEVKSADLKPKVLRKAIANKRRKVDAQFEADVEEYAALLLALPGATYRSVAEQTGIPKSTLQRRVPRKSNGTEEATRDGGAPVATSTVGPAVTTSFAMDLGAESIARREAKHAADDLTIPSFLKRERVT